MLATIQDVRPPFGITGVRSEGRTITRGRAGAPVYSNASPSAVGDWAGRQREGHHRAISGTSLPMIASSSCFSSAEWLGVGRIARQQHSRRFNRGPIARTSPTGTPRHSRVDARDVQFSFLWIRQTFARSAAAFRRSKRFGPPSRAGARASWIPGRVLRRSRRHAGAARGRRRDRRLPAAPQRQHALATIRRAPRPTRPSPRAREALADFLNAAPDEVAFGANMTTLTFHVARALARHGVQATRSSSPSSIITPTSTPWRRAARDRGLTVQPCGDAARDAPSSTGIDFERAIAPRTKLVAIGAASNALGTVNDVAARPSLAHAAGALAFVDAVHYAPHTLVDVAALGCDLLACSAYKFYGPHVGVLFGRRDLLGGLDVPKLQPAPDDGAGARSRPARRTTRGSSAPPRRWISSRRSVTTPRAIAAPRWPRLRRAAHAGRGAARTAVDGLSQIDGVRLYGRPPGLPRTPTVGFTVRGGTPATSPLRSPRAASSSRTAISTPRPPSNASRRAPAVSCAPAAPATPPKTKSTG